MLTDNHSRPITYLRLAVTDRCNLRCFYCMPAEGIKYLPKSALLSYEEMKRLVGILAQMGIRKIRLTGGEPFVRKDLIYFIKQLNSIKGIEEIHITTNGVLTTPFLPELKKLGIKSINLSLDSLDRKRFEMITRRDDFLKVKTCLEAVLAHQIPLKINAVVMADKNTEDIVPLAELTKEQNIAVRYIEEMPFNGEGQRPENTFWNYKKILAVLKEQYPQLHKIKDSPYSTSLNYAIPSYAGSVGIIPAFSRTFCGTCNRVRLTAQGTLKTCLYDEGVLDLKKLLRDKTISDSDLEKHLLLAFNNRAKDGFEAEKQRNFQKSVLESMSTIGG